MSDQPGHAARARHGRVCFVTSSFPRWEGDTSGTFILNLAQDLASIGWQILVLAPHAKGAASEEAHGGVRVVRFRYAWPESSETLCYGGGVLINLRRNRFNWSKVPLLVAAEWRALRKVVKQPGIDLIHSHWILPQGFVGSLVARSSRVPHVMTAHGSDVFQLGAGKLRGLESRVLRSADAVTVNSLATRDAVMNMGPGLRPPHVIPMGVGSAENDVRRGASVRRQLGLESARPLIGFVGRMVAEKGVADLLRAVALLAPRLPDLAMVLVGDGSERDEFQSLARTLGIEERVRFVGAIPAPAVGDFMLAFDMVVVPSWTEAQGLTAIEASMLSKPVIATAVGGLVEVIHDGSTGLLVPPRNPVAIAAAIERLSANPSLARALGEAGHKLVSARYSRAASADAFSALYRSLLGRRTLQPNDFR